MRARFMSPAPFSPFSGFFAFSAKDMTHRASAAPPSPDRAMR